MSTLLLKIAIIIAALNSMTTAAFADEQSPKVAIIAHAGRTAITGDLSSESSSPSFGFNALVYDKNTEPSDTLGGIRGLFLFDFASTKSTVSKTSKFPFEHGKSITLGETALVPTVCALANSPVQACLGAGYMMIDVKDEHNSQTYGALRGDLRVGQYLAKGLVGGLEVHTYSVEQKVSDVESSFLAVSYQAGLGYSW